MIFNCVSSLVSLLSFHLSSSFVFFSFSVWMQLHYAWKLEFCQNVWWSLELIPMLLQFFLPKAEWVSWAAKKEMIFLRMNEEFFLKAYVYRILRWISHRAPIYGLFPARDCLVQLACLCSRFEWGHLSLLETRRGHRYRLQDLRSQWIVRQWQPKVVLSIHRTKKKD